MIAPGRGDTRTTSTVRVLAGGGTWATHTSPIHPALRGMVVRYGGFEEPESGPVTRRELPYAGTPLILTFGSPYVLSEATDPDRPVTAWRSFVAGLHETRSTSKTTGATWTVQIDLTPIGAFRILGLPLAELTNQIVEAADILGSAVVELQQRLYHARGWDERFDLLDVFLLRRLAEAPLEAPEIAWVWGQLRAAHGNLQIADLCDEVQWSRRRLLGTFRDQLGLGPKMVARMLRFQRLLALDGQADAIPWSDLALRSGYYDQAHLIREFRAFAGITPETYRRLDRGAGVIEAAPTHPG